MHIATYAALLIAELEKQATELTDSDAEISADAIDAIRENLNVFRAWASTMLEDEEHCM